MTIDLDALEAVTKAVGPLPLDRQWTQREVIRAHQICLHAPALIAEHRAALAENTALRSALANSPGACVYCQLPANEMNRCASGFPGCGRADDMQGCPHFGTAEIPEDIQEQHVALLARVEELEVVAREFVEAVRLADEIYEPAVDRAYRRAAAALEPKP